MYFETQDVEIYMTDFYVTADAKDDTGGTTEPSGGGTMVMNEAFGGCNCRRNNIYMFQQVLKHGQVLHMIQLKQKVSTQ